MVAYWPWHQLSFVSISITSVSACNGVFPAVHVSEECSSWATWFPHEQITNRFFFSCHERKVWWRHAIYLFIYFLLYLSMRCCHWGTSSVLYSRSAYGLWPVSLGRYLYVVEVAFHLGPISWPTTSERSPTGRDSFFFFFVLLWDSIFFSTDDVGFVPSDERKYWVACVVVMNSMLYAIRRI